MTTFPINLPEDDGIAKLSISMQSVVRESVSPYTFKGSQLVYPGAAWGLTIEIPPVGRAIAQRWIAFLAKLNGRYGTFQCGIPGHERPLGSARDAPGVPRVNGANQQGGWVDIDGVPANTYEYLAEGDFFQVGTRLYVATERANSNGSGQCRIECWPYLDAEHGDNTVVVVSGARGLWRLKDNLRTLALDQFDTYGATIVCEEAQ